MARIASCVSCGSHNLHNAHVVRLADSGEKDRYLCASCGSLVVSNSADFPVVVGAPMSHGMEFRFVVHCSADATIRAEFMQGAPRKTSALDKGEGAWIPTADGFMSPWFRNRKNHRRFVTLRKLVSANQYRPAHGKVQTIEVYVRKDGKLLTAASFKLDREFLELVTELVESL